ncbi:MAG: hypothetical protein K2X98_06635 [Alphaproteobacteria bacterium]|nr:hypothetical protein [Alphaproteobacteria bacterium]
MSLEFFKHAIFLDNMEDKEPFEGRVMDFFKATIDKRSGSYAIIACPYSSMFVVPKTWKGILGTLELYLTMQLQRVGSQEMELKQGPGFVYCYEDDQLALSFNLAERKNS